MKADAVILDLYQTLLTVGPPPRHADASWRRLARPIDEAAPSLAGFAAACRSAIEVEHRRARAAGIAWPEVNWDGIACTAWPALLRLPASARARLLAAHAGLVRTVRMPAAAATFLRTVSAQGIPLGLASNAQPYTLVELRRELARHGLRPHLFDRTLCFFSFEHGFAKPDPHVFRLLAARLALRRVTPDRILMVGDRADNDLEPARRAGWQTWHLDAAAPRAQGWTALRRALTGGTVRRPS